LLFLCYILPLQAIIEQHGIGRHGYADDTQLYCSLTINDEEMLQQERRRMERCIDDVRQWMYQNKLKINETKTEVLVVARKVDTHKVDDVELRVGDAFIRPKSVVKNLGALFDSELTMKPQGIDVARRAGFHLRAITHIRPHLSNSACVQAIHAAVTSRLDFHNALLLGAPKLLLRKLQVVQNSAARVLTRTPARDHITPVLARLHWLPIEKRIEYKTLCLIHNALYDPSAPQYLRDMCSVYLPVRPLRSADQLELTVARTHNSHDERAFSRCAVRLWNTLPQTLRAQTDGSSFRKQLKTILFRESYGFQA